ncbi:MAG: hypothetical protein IKT27_01870 [Clostridia bacterium]|nr:hypothetical protein [Clostridia bacterium]
MKALKIIGNCSLVFLAIIGVCVSLAYAYYHFFVKDVTTGANYIDNQIAVDIIPLEDLTEEEKNEFEKRYFMEANFFSNSKNNGIALQELKFNYFTDYSLSSNAYRSTGMQYLGDLKQSDLIITETTTQEAQRYESTAFSYYDTTNGISWEGNKLRTQLNRESAFIIKIDNRAFQIQLTGAYEWTTYKRSWWSLWLYNQLITNILYYNYVNVFADCMEAIRTNDKGYGDYYITVDLSEYFTIREYDISSGKFKEDNVTDIIKNYSVLKFHYDENGARNSTQSMFGIIDCNPSYDITEEEIDTTYWQERMVYTLNEDDFSYRYSEVYQGYFLSLDMDTKKMFDEMPRAKVNVNIDLKSQYLKDKNINIVGLDYNAFEGFEIDTLTIKGDLQKLYLLEKSLYDTNLQTFIHSKVLEIDIAQNAINNEYQEVAV